MPKAKPSRNTKSTTNKMAAPPVTEEAMPKKKSVERVKKDAKKGKEKEVAQVPRPKPRKKTADALASPTAPDPEIRGPQHPPPRADTPLAVAANDTTTPAKASHKTHHVTSEMSSGSSQQVAMEVVMEENRRLKEQLGGRTYVSVDRPSERKRNNPYDIAPLRKILGVHPVPEDPDYLKELKNEAYNFLRETARDIIGDQQLAKTLDRAAHWDNLLEDKQKELRDQFVNAVRKGGAFGLTFFTKPSTGSEHKFAMDWPANELIKTVLRDQSTGTGSNTLMAPIANSDIAFSAKTTSAQTHPVASMEMSINDIEQAYGEFIPKDAEERMYDDAEAGLGDEGQNLSLPDDDEEDEEDQDQEHDSDDDEQDPTACGSDLSSSESSGSK
ncbi:hypothetical protein QFC22_003502 [Naganishia vaughanmartiniae]|uniref:Uncharacterized protein n=1 Tax=Naganishia vaughanmartiniae TaxID=1424756 RepID=A0ACC2X5L7_9TREE|nr:hypothetical protein QFC22_003502 [Naganishia vaughanmartiniae]